MIEKETCHWPLQLVHFASWEVGLHQTQLNPTCTMRMAAWRGRTKDIKLETQGIARLVLMCSAHSCGPSKEWKAEEKHMAVQNHDYLNSQNSKHMHILGTVIQRGKSAHWAHLDHRSRESVATTHCILCRPQCHHHKPHPTPWPSMAQSDSGDIAAQLHKGHRGCP